MAVGDGRRHSPSRSRASALIHLKVASRSAPAGTSRLRTDSQRHSTQTAGEPTSGVHLTVGESFELNVAAAQEAGTLIKTAKPIILAQGSVRGKWNYSYFRTTHAGSISQLAQLQFASNDSPTVS